jgi:hypothetical protein
MSGMPGLPGLVPYYAWVDEHLPLPNGRKRSKRSAQVIAQRYNLPLVRLGLGAVIDTEKAAHQLREAQLTDRTPRGRGRPQGKVA